MRFAFCFGSVGGPQVSSLHCSVSAGNTFRVMFQLQRQCSCLEKATSSLLSPLWNLTLGSLSLFLPLLGCATGLLSSFPRETRAQGQTALGRCSALKGSLSPVPQWILLPCPVSSTLYPLLTLASFIFITLEGGREVCLALWTTNVCCAFSCCSQMSPLLLSKPKIGTIGWPW